MNREPLRQRIASLDWPTVYSRMNASGYAIVEGILNAAECFDLRTSFEESGGFRKTVVMERHRFGAGCYKYWDYPLPATVQVLREALYPGLVPLANTWMERLGNSDRYPDMFDDFQASCHSVGQLKPTPLILNYTQGGYNRLHQDLYGERFFPIQAAIILSAPGKDFTGGEFVLTEQLPRAQSKACVLQPGLGDMIIFTTRQRPIAGTRGYYRVNLRHGVSEVLSGHRYAMGIIFHDATS